VIFRLTPSQLDEAVWGTAAYGISRHLVDHERSRLRCDETSPIPLPRGWDQDAVVSRCAEGRFLAYLDSAGADPGNLCGQRSPCIDCREIALVEGTPIYRNPPVARWPG